MVIWRLIFIALVIILFGIFINYILRLFLGIEIEILSSIYGYLLILFVSILLAFSAFLPYKWGKIFREIAYFCLFILILLVEINIVKPYIKLVDIPLENCEKWVIPSRGETGSLVYDALKYTSCVLSGKFPAEAGDIGWTAFYLFYLILPFAFIFSFIYGLMKSMDLSNWFGGREEIPKVLSFIIAMYAARTMLGGFILQFAGYGALGLAAVFLAIFLVRGLQHMIESWYKIEEMGESIREMIKTGVEIKKIYAKTAIDFLEKNEIEKSLRSNDMKYLANIIGLIENGLTQEIELFKLLDNQEQSIIRGAIDRIKKNVSHLTERMRAYQELLNLLKSWK